MQDALGMGVLQPLQNLEHVELHGEQLINGRALSRSVTHNTPSEEA